MEIIRKDKMEKELSKCTKIPQLIKNKNIVIKKEFLERQKDYSENVNKKKEKILETIKMKKKKKKKN